MQIFVAIMFVQATQSRRQNKTYISYLVRESFRTAQGPRSRTVCNSSPLPAAVRELIAAALSGKSLVALEELQLSAALDYGGLAVLRDAWQGFGLERLFDGIGSGAPAPAFSGHDLWADSFPLLQTGPCSASTG